MMANQSRIESVVTWRAIFLLFLCAIAIFFGIIFGWRFIDETLGKREVARFIADHEAVVAEKLRDPRVHAFALNPCPSEPWRLLVETDTDDKAAFEMLQESPDGIDKLRFVPLWQWKIRSGEEPRNLGHPDRDVQEIQRTMSRGALAVLIALLGPFLVYLIWLVRKHVRESRRAAESAGPVAENAGKS
jgi:hypothetical protein